MTIQEESFTTQAIMVFLAVMLILVTTIGNGSFLAILARFKVFRRNVANILFASLAVVDCLNAIFNISLFIMYFVVEANWLEGKAWAIITSSLHLEFGLLNLVSMTALMLDRFLAVYLGVKYFTWKTAKKAKLAVFLMWLVCTLVVVLSAVPAFYMDLDGVPIMQSRTMIFQERKVIIAPLMAVCTLASTVLGILTCYSIRQKKKERKQLNLPPLAAEARLKMDIKATYTVAMAVVMYYICYIPTIVFSFWLRSKEQPVLNPWLTFIVAFFSFASGALNPVIYVLRSRRNRSAIRQLLKNPCGTSAYQEIPVREENKARQQQIKLPQIEREEFKDRRGPAAAVNAVPIPESDTRRQRRPTSAKIQIHQSHSVVKMAWKKKEDSSSLRADEEVAAGEWRRGGEKIQDKKGELSDSVCDKDEECNKAAVTSLRANPNLGSDPRRPTSAKIQIHQSPSVVKMERRKNEDSGSLRADKEVAARESRRGGEKVQDEGGESSDSVSDKHEECHKAPATTLRADTNPGSDTKRPTSAELQIHQPHRVVKLACKRNEEDSSSLDEPFAVAGQSRRDVEKVPDKEGESAGSVRDKKKKKNAAERNGIGTSPGVQVRPFSPPVS